MSSQLFTDEHWRRYQQSGCVALRLPLRARVLVRLLDDIARLVKRAEERPLHAAMLSGVHNPWGFASRLLDSWSILDLCESPLLLDCIEAILGPDIVLWDSALRFAAVPASHGVPFADEAGYWPVTPLAGVLVTVALPMDADQCEVEVILHDIRRLEQIPSRAIETAQLLIRYLPATSHFERDSGFPAHQAMAQYDPLINYASRPLWLVRGQDRAKNDFVTGFDVMAPSWS